MSKELEAPTHCPVCQRSARQGRISLRFLWQRLVEEVLGDRRSFRITFVDLFRNPGEVVRAYLDGRDLRYFSPLKYFLTILALSLFLPVPRFMDNLLANLAVKTGRLDVAQAGEFVRDWNTLLYLPMLLLLGLVTRYFYRAQRFNYAEHLVIAAYGWSQLTILSVLAFLVAPLARRVPELQIVGMALVVLTPFYWFWFCHRVFGQSGVPAVLRAFVTLPCAVVLYLLVAMMISTAFNRA